MGDASGRAAKVVLGTTSECDARSFPRSKTHKPHLVGEEGQEGVGVWVVWGERGEPIGQISFELVAGNVESSTVRFVDFLGSHLITECLQNSSGE